MIKKVICRENNLGFTLVELLLIIGILFFLAGIATPVFRFFQKESDLTNSVEEIINTLRLAQNKTLASEGKSSWGIYFSTSTTPHQYVLFKGSNYVTRDAFFDEIHNLPRGIEIYEIDLVGGGSEIIFNRIVGTTNQFGKISLRLKEDISKNKKITVQSSGQITLGEETPPGDENRIKDSRHIHFNYSRQISTLTESLKLTFTYNTSETTKDIIIAENLKDGQIYWEGEVVVGGEIQKLKIHTHRLNDATLGTQFCVHRDRRYNNRALKIEISGESGVDLIKYDANGQIAPGTSIYVSQPIRQ